MTKLALVGASLLAYGHPSNCTEPAPGSVTGSSSLTVNGTPLAVKNDSSMDFSSHAHAHNSDDGCHAYSSHSIQPDNNGLSGSITVGGNPVYLDGDNVATDPGSGGVIDMTDTGGNASISVK